MCDFEDSTDVPMFKGYDSYVADRAVNLEENPMTDIYDFKNAPLVSAYDSYNSPIPNKTVNLLKALTTDKYMDEALRYRNSGNDRERKQIKSSLPCITVSGIFKSRSESDIVKHSYFMCIDIDGKDQIEEWIDWEAMKKLIGELFGCVYFIGLSISGNGIFIIVKMRNPLYHKMHYRAFAKEISEATGLKVDMSCSDIARLRGASYDPFPYYNANPTQYNKVMINEPKRPKKTNSKSQMEKTRENVEAAIKLINTHKIDITNEYQAWLKIALAIYDAFGEEGRGYFHLISSIYAGYREDDCDTMYDKCETWGTDVRIETFFYLCKIHGIVNSKGGMVYDPSIITDK